MILISVRPYHPYEDGKPSKEITGYKYEVVLPRHNFDHMDVKIEGDRRLDLADGQNIPVVLDGLKVRPYVNSGTNRLDFTAQADNIRKLEPRRG